MTCVIAYLTLVLTIGALACGHQGQDFPPFWAWRHLRARRAHHEAPPAPSPTLARPRPVPSWAHTEPYDYDEAA
ncbi:hypothetical protein [Streptomyces spiralis]|uniref:hypothetical protein n=1 Tax=Streptomyces spiralis TaxID=66376 RepID=UPI0036761236